MGCEGPVEVIERGLGVDMALAFFSHSFARHDRFGNRLRTFDSLAAAGLHTIHIEAELAP
jgi:hypothetical protein